jgi:hypothetical protein
MPLELEHVPFMEKMRLKELDGVYKNVADESIAVFKNAYRRGYIAEPEGKESYCYDAITVSLNSEVHGKIKRCLVNMDDWKRILDL